MTFTEKREILANKCHATSIIIKTKTPEVLKYAAIPLKCNSWLCPRCAPKLKRAWAGAIEMYFANERVRFLTLTMPGLPSAADTWKAAPAAWNRLRGAITRLKRKKIKYVRVLESTKSGRAHYHILINAYIPALWLQKAAVRAGFGIQHQIKDVQSNGLANYIGKYLSKQWKAADDGEACLAVNARRVQGSRGFKLHRKSGGGSSIFERPKSSPEARRKLLLLSERCYEAHLSCDITGYISGYTEIAFAGGMDWSGNSTEILEFLIDRIADEMTWEI